MRIKKILVLLLSLLFFSSCAKDPIIKGSNIDEVLNIIKEYDEGIIISDEDNKINVKYEDEKLNYEFNFIISENRGIYEVNYKCDGKIDREFLFNVFEKIFNDDINEKIQVAIKQILDNEAGGHYQYEDDNINLDFELALFESEFNIYSNEYKNSN